ncbi:DUF1642 domain-containing protein [Enterococcus sp. 22-H-5-01]|uniref:DUF1642 domain-containing protein n=1 Tax=Enterococcus sp. 22-H-5-01 TaxID=3418555 RepID=UPI003D03F651
MDKQEIIERLNNKLSETLKFQQIFEPLSEGHSGCESRANAYMTAINYVEQLDEPQKVKVPAYVAEYIEAHRKWGPGIFIGDWLADNDAVDKWLYNNSEKENNRRFLIAVKAFVEGYEVEETPKYYVQLPFIEWNEEAAELEQFELYLGFDITSDETRFTPLKEGYRDFKTKLDEETIKSIDERYWPFAVPIEKVEV